MQWSHHPQEGVHMTDVGAASDDPTRADLPPAPAVDPAAALAQMAGLVLSRETVDTALELVTSLAATAGTFGAAVSVVDEHGKRSRAASNSMAEQADALQYEL